MSSDNFLEVAFFSPLYRNEELVVLDEGVQILDDVFVVKWLGFTIRIPGAAALLWDIYRVLSGP